MKIHKEIAKYIAEFPYISEDIIHEYVINSWNYFDELFMDLAKKYEQGNERQAIWSKVIKSNRCRSYTTIDKFYEDLISNNNDNIGFYKYLHKINKIPYKYMNRCWPDITEIKKMLKECNDDDLLEHRKLFVFYSKYLNLVYNAQK